MRAGFGVNNLMSQVFSLPLALFILMFALLNISYANQLDSKLVLIPGGDFEPFWFITSKSQVDKNKIERVADFYLDRYPVTQKEFLDFVKSNSKWQKNKISSLQSDDKYLSNWISDTEIDSNVDIDSPVVFVSWFAARAYCEAQGKRLPSIMEWEFVSRASTDKVSAEKDEKFLELILNWYSKPQDQKLPKVGKNFKNIYGVYDFHGLIWEWVDDFNLNLVSGESREDSSFNRDLFCGAGSLKGADKTNYAAYMRFAFRASLKGKYSVANLGFRCAKDK